MKYQSYDEQYNKLLHNVIENGKWELKENARTKYADGEVAYTKYVTNQSITIDNSKDPCLLTSKRCAVKDPIKEIRWIWQFMSNDVNVLNEMGCTVWDEWKKEDGTIGKAYGWQLKNKLQSVIVDKLFLDMYYNLEFSLTPTNLEKEMKDYFYGMIESKQVIERKLNQVDYLLYQLKKNPHSRRIITTLWCVEDLHEMALTPCVYETHWQMFGDELELTVKIRSNDSCLGNSYNVTQYSILHKVIAQVTGHKVGKLHFVIDNFHIYDRHIETAKEQLQGELHEQPVVKINPDIKSFYDFTEDDVTVENYKHNGKFKYEIAI